MSLIDIEVQDFVNAFEKVEQRIDEISIIMGWETGNHFQGLTLDTDNGERVINSNSVTYSSGGTEGFVCTVKLSDLTEDDNFWKQKRKEADEEYIRKKEEKRLNLIKAQEEADLKLLAKLKEKYPDGVK